MTFPIVLVPQTTVHIYLEYYRACPPRLHRNPRPSPASECVLPPPEPKGGETHSPVGEEWGSQFGRLEKKPSTLSALCLVLSSYGFSFI